MDIRTVALFKGGFAEPTEKEGPTVLEDRLRPPADWLREELRSAGLAVGPSDWIDYAYELSCTVNDRTYEVEVSYDFLTWDWFEITYGPTIGFFSKLLGRDESAELTVLSQAIDRSLKRHESITEVRWYTRMPTDPDVGFTHSPV